jgi:hypothetical protein
MAIVIAILVAVIVALLVGRHLRITKRSIEVGSDSGMRIAARDNAQVDDVRMKGPRGEKDVSAKGRARVRGVVMDSTGDGGEPKNADSG